jgi:acyl-CoA synthetase (AMP-forming)/AMP-acid ligase II
LYTGGENVYPKEVEDVLYARPQVKRGNSPGTSFLIDLGHLWLMLKSIINRIMGGYKQKDIK